MTTPRAFALISNTKLVRPHDLHRMRWALEVNARHCAEAWHLDDAPGIEVIDRIGNLPPWAQPVVFVDESTDAGALAVHYWTPQRGVAARVYVHETSGLHEGPNSVCEATSHEIVESLVDPMLNLWADHPMPERARQGVQVAVECADPCQDTYVVNDLGTDWPVANFVTPHWFDARLADYLASAEVRFDHAGRLRRPGQIGSEGYAVLRAPAAVAPGGYGTGAWRTWLVDAWGKDLGTTDLRAGKAHAWARTSTRIGDPHAGQGSKP